MLVTQDPMRTFALENLLLRKMHVEGYFAYRKSLM